MRRFKRKGLKRLAAAALALCTACQVWLAGPDIARANEAAEPSLKVNSALLMDAVSGQILYAMNAEEALPPASMTKMMTEYIVMEQIKAGKLSWDDLVETSKYSSDVPGSGDLLAYGEKLTVRQMFQAMSIYSGNDATVALAEKIGGTEEDFVKLMNEKAQQFGMKTAHFATSTGLGRTDLQYIAGAPQFEDGKETVMSALDAATLAFRVVNDHPEVLEFAKIPTLKLRERDNSPMINWNWMLESNSAVQNFKRFAYPGLDGLKTGYTKEAGYCFAGTAIRDGMRLISVVMGTGSEAERFDETRKLLDYGFNNYEMRTLVSAKSEIEQMKSVRTTKGVRTEVPVVTEKGIAVLVKKGTPEQAYEWKAEPLERDKRVAPIKQGTAVGMLTITYDGKELQTPMITAHDLERGSWGRLLFRGIRDFHVRLFEGIVDLFPFGSDEADTSKA